MGRDAPPLARAGHLLRLFRSHRGSGSWLRARPPWRPAICRTLRRSVPHPARPPGARRAFLRPPRRQSDPCRALCPRSAHLGVHARRHGAYALLAFPAVQRGRRVGLGGCDRGRRLLAWDEPPAAGDDHPRHRYRRAGLPRRHWVGFGARLGTRNPPAMRATPPPRSSTPSPPSTWAVPMLSARAAASSTGSADTPLMVM